MWSCTDPLPTSSCLHMTNSLATPSGLSLYQLSHEHRWSTGVSVVDVLLLGCEPMQPPSSLSRMYKKLCILGRIRCGLHFLNRHWLGIRSKTIEIKNQTWAGIWVMCTNRSLWCSKRMLDPGTRWEFIFSKWKKKRWTKLVEVEIAYGVK